MMASARTPSPSSAPLGLAIAAVSADQTEGNTGSKAFGFTFTRSGDLSTAIFVPWAVTGSGANPADAADFANGVLPSGSIALAVGEASKTLAVNVRGDTQVEPDEGFLVTLSSPTHGAASAHWPDPQRRWCSLDLDRGDQRQPQRGVERARPPSASPSPARATSRPRPLSPGRSPAAAPTRPTPPTSPTACCPPARIAFAAGEASKALMVRVHGDTQLEPNEGFPGHPLRPDQRRRHRHGRGQRPDPERRRQP